MSAAHNAFNVAYATAAATTINVVPATDPAFDAASNQSADPWARNLNDALKKKVRQLPLIGNSGTVSSGKRHSIAGEPYRKIEDREIAKVQADYYVARYGRYSDVCGKYHREEITAITAVCDAFKARIAGHVSSAKLALRAAHQSAKVREAAAPTPCKRFTEKKRLDDARDALNDICRREYDAEIKKFTDSNSVRYYSATDAFYKAEHTHLQTAKKSEYNRSSRRKMRAEKERESAAALERSPTAAKERKNAAASMLPDLPSYSEAVSGCEKVAASMLLDLPSYSEAVSSSTLAAAAEREKDDAMAREKTAAMEREKAAASEREKVAAMAREKIAAMERQKAAAMEREKAAAAEREKVSAMALEKAAAMAHEKAAAMGREIAAANARNKEEKKRSFTAAMESEEAALVAYTAAKKRTVRAWHDYDTVVVASDAYDSRRTAMQE
jgi:hypothetical protein